VRIAGRSAVVSLSLLSLCVAGCGSGSPRFTGREEASVSTSQLEGIASYYADEFHGRTTSNGETYDMNALTAAHRTLPFNSRVRVTNRENGKSVVVRINDRGPFKGDRVIDLSLAAAKILDMIPHGTTYVTIDVIEAGTQ
jgi:rare lipoprotein A